MNTRRVDTVEDFKPWPYMAIIDAPCRPTPQAVSAKKAWKKRGKVPSKKR